MRPWTQRKVFILPFNTFIKADFSLILISLKICFIFINHSILVVFCFFFLNHCKVCFISTLLPIKLLQPFKDVPTFIKQLCFEVPTELADCSKPNTYISKYSKMNNGHFHKFLKFLLRQREVVIKVCNPIMTTKSNCKTLCLSILSLQQVCTLLLM